MAGHAVIGRALVVCVSLVAATAAARAQAPVVVLRGIAFDSVAMQPLPGAYVVLDGARNARADAGGYFTFDSVRLGVHELEMQHPALDSMGLAGISASVALLDGDTPVLLTVPSFPTLWRVACGERAAPADSGFVYGVVRDARNGTEVPRALVVLSWMDLTLVNVREFRQQRYRAEIEADANGEYAVCGVPLDVGLQIAASHADAASAPTGVGSMLRVRRRDLLIGPFDSATAPRGSVVGVVTHMDGRPFEGATVVLDDAQPQRTEADGKFAFANVLTGTRQLEVLAIGARPRTIAVDVMAGEAASTLVTMDRLTTLDVVRVLGTRWQLRTLEELSTRMARGVGQFRDSSQLGNRQLLGAVFSGFRGLEMRFSRGGEVGTLEMRGSGMTRRCSPTLWIDGYREEGFTWLNLLNPQDIAVMEVYDRPELVPFRFSRAGDACGAIVIWTKDVVP